jgi:hypothetical protein
MTEYRQHIDSLRQLISGATATDAWGRKPQIAFHVEMCLGHVGWSEGIGAAATDMTARCYEYLKIASRPSAVEAEALALGLREALAAIDGFERALDEAASETRGA